MWKQLLISLGILLFLLTVTALIIIYGRGYQIDFHKGRPEISGTGLLVATSNPDGAAVYINDHLTTATNNTINLAPGTYNVKIVKEAFFPWEKTITVEKEVVAKAEAFLFAKAPKLESITDMGVSNPSLDPSNTKIAFTVASQSAKKNGIYILNMNAGPFLTLQSAATQIADDTTDTLSTAQLMWSPDGQTILATVTKGDKSTTYELSASGFNDTPKDVTDTLSSLLDQWNTDVKEKRDAQIAALKQDLQTFVTDNFSIIAWSPDESKILYEASNSAQLPIMITPPLIGTDSTPEQRSIQKGSVYVYDLKEDKNFLITPDPIKDLQHSPISWMPDSKHLLYVQNKKIEALEYDGENKTILYAGPFVDDYVFPWPNGTKFVIVTNLGNTEITPNLYTVTLK